MDVYKYHFVFLLCLGVLPSPSSSNIFDSMSAPTICTSEHTASSTSGAQPAMHGLPTQYKVSVEASMSKGGWGFWAEESFDSSSELASIRLAVSGRVHHTIFVTFPFERYVVQDEDTCTIEIAGVDFHPLAFASMTQTTLTPSKLSFRLLFRSAIESNGLIYVGKSTIRGISVNHWTLCQEWTDKSAKIQTDFYVSVPGYKSSWNQEEIPIRVEMKGTTGLFNTDHIPSSSTFENVYDFGSLQTGPPTQYDDDVFQVPTRVVCTGRSIDNWPLPELPDVFEMNVELNSPHVGTTVPLVSSLKYDWQNQLLETIREFPANPRFTGDGSRGRGTWTNNGQAQAESVGLQKLSWVEDYSTGIQYITEMTNNTCMVRQTPTPDNTMSHGNMLLTMYNDKKNGLSQLTYQGRSTMRGMPVEAWGLDKDGVVQKFFFLSKTRGTMNLNVDTSNMTTAERNEYRRGMRQVRISQFNRYPVFVGMVVRNRKAINSKNFPTLIKNLLAEGVFEWSRDRVILSTDSDASPTTFAENLSRFFSWTRLQEMQTEHIGELDVFVQHFMPRNVENDMFLVAQCYKSEEKSKVMLTVKASYEAYFRQDPLKLLHPLRVSIAKAIGVSIIKISNVQATPAVNKEKGIDHTLVTFDLLGAVAMKENNNNNNNNNNKQKGIKTSKASLITAIRNGISFSAQYYSDMKTFYVDKTLFEIDFNIENLPVVKGGRKMVGDKDRNDDNDDDDDDDDDDDEGLSGGVVAGLTIVIAIAASAITVLIIVVYVKTRRPDLFNPKPFATPDI